MYGRRGFSHKTSIQNEHLFIIFHPATHVLRNKPLLWLSENSKMNYHVHFCFSKLYTEKKSLQAEHQVQAFFNQIRI